MWVSRILGLVGRLLITAGVIILLFAAFQLWGTGVQESKSQSALTHSAASKLGVGRSSESDDAAVKSITDKLSGVDPKTATDIPAPGEGAWIGLIEIPKIGLAPRSMVEGVGKSDLRKGPGHYPGTPLPGQAGNAAVAGHRTTYGAPFNRIDELVPGDKIYAYTLQGKFTYEVTAPPAGKGIDRGAGWFTVRPSDVSVLAPSTDNLLTLTACHPKYSADKRIIVVARLVADPAPATPTTTVPASTATSAPTVSQLDTGFAGEGDSFRPAVLWGIGFLIVFVAASIVSAVVSRRKWLVWLISSPALIVLLWFCFVFTDRWLPSL